MHIPVLFEETLEVLDPKPGKIFIDATVNGGGHARAIAERVAPSGKVIGIDWDSGLVERLKTAGIPRFTPICDSYVNIREIAERLELTEIDGVLFDLGFSSYHVDESGRGFSFLRDEPLDMRYHAEGQGLTAEKIINSWPEEKIEEIIRMFGEDRFSKKIAGAIVAARKSVKIERTGVLAEIIRRAVRGRGRIHPATRTFQALRIAVNGELENIEPALSDAFGLLKISGVLAVISFHSLEDRIVKHFFQKLAKESGAAIITKKPIIASQQELRQNPRSRSAKLRAIKKLM